jgi:dihydropyrimidine dehydrogenase (NAD+) subunit PreA
MDMAQKQVSLEVEFAGLTFRNPFLLASGPPTRDAYMLDRAFEAGWSGAVIKTIPSEALMNRGLKEEPRPLLAVYKSGARKIGMGNLSITGEWRIDEWAANLPWLKEKHPDSVVFGSFGAQINKKVWQEMAIRLAKAGFDAIELDLSCTHATLGEDETLIVGEDPRLSEEVVRWVTEVVDVPVIPKLPATVKDWTRILRACKDAGAAGLTSINTLSSLMGVDLDTMLPIPNVDGYGTYCGYSGPGIKPIALRVISQIHKADVLPACGVGGISTWEDAAEFLLLGARTVQVCTAVMWSGYGIVDKMIAGLTGYLQKNEMESLETLIGKANNRIKENIFEIKPADNLVAYISDQCSDCKRCVTACWDGGHQAIMDPDDGHPFVEVMKCSGCALCLQVCPMKAISLRPRDKGVPSAS